MSQNQVKKKKKRAKQKRPIRSLILGFVFTCLVFYLGITAIETAIKIKETNDKIAVAKSQADAIEQENNDTKSLLKNADENDIIERIARERLGYVFPDEKVFYDVN